MQKKTIKHIKRRYKTIKYIERCLLLSLLMSRLQLTSFSSTELSCLFSVGFIFLIRIASANFCFLALFLYPFSIILQLFISKTECPLSTKCLKRCEFKFSQIGLILFPVSYDQFLLGNNLYNQFWDISLGTLYYDYV